MPRLIELPDDGIIYVPIIDGGQKVGEKVIDLSCLPTVDAVPVVHGRWEHTHTSASYYWECWKCSVCGFEDTEGYDFRFCPNCGAKMDGGESDATD